MAARTRMLTLDELVAAARRLSPRDRLRLIEHLAADLAPSVSTEAPVRGPDEASGLETDGPEPVEKAASAAPAGSSPDKPPPRPSLYGLWADLGVDLSEEEIRQLRREAWAGLGNREI